MYVRGKVLSIISTANSTAKTCCSEQCRYAPRLAPVAVWLFRRPPLVTLIERIAHHDEFAKCRRQRFSYSFPGDCRLTSEGSIAKDGELSWLLTGRARI